MHASKAGSLHSKRSPTNSRNHRSLLAKAGDEAFPPRLLLLPPHAHALPHILVLPVLVLQAVWSASAWGLAGHSWWAAMGWVALSTG